MMFKKVYSLFMMFKKVYSLFKMFKKVYSLFMMFKKVYSLLHNYCGFLAFVNITKVYLYLFNFSLFFVIEHVSDSPIMPSEHYTTATKELWSYYVMLCLSFICRQIGFSVITSWWIFDTMSLVIELKYWLGYCSPTLFKTRDHKVHGELIFLLILMDCFVMNSLWTSLSEKCISLLCNCYRFYIKGVQSGTFPIFNFFIFHPILMHFFCKMIISIGNLWAIKKLAILFKKRV
jgi:hypothetical protein